MRIAPRRLIFHALGVVFVVLTARFACDGEYLIAGICAPASGDRGADGVDAALGSMMGVTTMTRWDWLVVDAALLGVIAILGWEAFKAFKARRQAAARFHGSQGTHRNVFDKCDLCECGPNLFLAVPPHRRRATIRNQRDVMP